MLLLSLLVNSISAQEIDVWIGTSGSEGIYHLKLNTEDGKLTEPRNVSKISSAGFLAMHPTKNILYSTGRQGGKYGVAAFSIGKTRVVSAKPVAVSPPNPELKAAQMRLADLAADFGPDHPAIIDVKRKLAALNKLPKKKLKKTPAAKVGKKSFGLTSLGFVETGDGGAAHVAVDKSAKVVMSAQYSGGSISTYTLNPNGSIKQRVRAVKHGAGSGVKKKRQDASHPHWVGTSPDNKFLMVPDLGRDAVIVYKLDLESGKVAKHAEVPSPPGAGPRHMKFHTSGKYAYVLNELTLSVSVFEYQAADAKFKKLQEIKTLPDELKDDQLQSAAEIRIHPSGKFVYTSNRGHDSITVFAVDQDSGKLKFVQRESIRGAWPRNFNIEPTGKWLLAAGRNTNTLTLFSIDQETGKLAYARKSVNVPAPICVVFGR